MDTDDDGVDQLEPKKSFSPPRFKKFSFDMVFPTLCILGSELI